MKKITLFAPSRVWGGVEKNVLLRARLLSEAGHHVQVVLLRGYFKDRFKGLPNVSVSEVAFRGGDLNPLVIYRYWRLLSSFRPDMVFVSSKQDWWLSSVASKLAGVPNIVLYLGISRDIKNRIKFRWLFHKFKARVVVNSDSLKNELLANSIFFDDGNLIRIYNGFPLPDVTPDLCQLRKIELLDQLNLPSNTFLIGLAGRFSRQKGLDLLPSIIEPLPNNVHVIHAGSGPLENEIKSLLLSSPIKHRIHFLGQQSDMSMFYSALDTFLLCSRNEGMANVLNEALSYGKPTVSTRVPGSEELLNHGEFGILCDIEDSEGLSSALSQIINQEVEFDFDHQRAQIENNYSLKAMFDNTMSLLC